MAGADRNDELIAECARLVAATTTLAAENAKLVAENTELRAVGRASRGSGDGVRASSGAELGQLLVGTVAGHPTMDVYGHVLTSVGDGVTDKLRGSLRRRPQ